MKYAYGLMAFFSAVMLTGSAEVPSKVSDLIAGGELNEAEKYVREHDENLTEFESDSLLAIMQRIRNDFRIPYEDGVKQLQEKYPNATPENLNDWEQKKYLETMTIDGEKYLFRKAISNIRRLVPELSADCRAENIQKDLCYAEYAGQAMKGNEKYRVTIRFTIDVESGKVPAGEAVRVWMPFPIENGRQSNIRIESSSDEVMHSKGSIHNTIYMEKNAEKDKNTHFEAVYSYDVEPLYYSPEYIESQLKPYDKSSTLYKKYTSTEFPQFVLTEKMRSLAEKIVGTETNPLRQAALVYDWIDAYFPWAGAREYSTIPNLAEYVLENGHGDCGQVSTLYITLLRSLGIPARWESGWMLHPGQVGMHDWAEVYYEGVGWVPVDMSFGLLEVAGDTAVRNFYKTGIDVYRMASNKGVGGVLSPAKNYVRSETVDFQLGEVEWDGGNLFYYTDFTPDLEVIGFEKIK